MTAQNKKAKFTYEDYLQTPEDKRYELIDGDLIFEPAPKTRHQRITGKLYRLLADYVDENNAGEVFIAPTDVYFDNENVFEPDILFISRDRLHIIEEDNIKGAPDLVVEVISPSSGYRDLVKKKRLYAEFGVKEYWIVDPDEKTAETLVLKDHEKHCKKNRNAEDHVLKNRKFETAASLNESDALTSEMFPGLLVDLKEVFG